jgi:hypothetical protein
LGSFCPAAAHPGFILKKEGFIVENRVKSVFLSDFYIKNGQNHLKINLLQCFVVRQKVLPLPSFLKT